MNRTLHDVDVSFPREDDAYEYYGYFVTLYFINRYPRGLVMTENEGGAIDLTTIIVVVAILALILWASQSPQVGLDQITNLLGMA